jgi:hypothetical protein
MFWELVRIKLAVEFSFLSVQPRRNGSQNASQYTSTLAQQLWSCNFLDLRFVKPVVKGGSFDAGYPASLNTFVST